MGLSPDGRQRVLENRSRLVGRGGGAGGCAPSPTNPHSLRSERKTPLLPSFCLSLLIDSSPTASVSGSELFSFKIVWLICSPANCVPVAGVPFGWMCYSFNGFVCRNLPDDTGTGEILAGSAAGTLADQCSNEQGMLF